MRTTWASGGLSVAFPALTGLLLLLAYPPYDLSALAWCALVPLLWCVFLGVDEPRDSRPLSSGRRRRTGVGKGGRAASSWDRAVALAWVGGLVWGIGLFYPLLMIREGTWVERVGGTAIIALLTATMLSLFYAAAVRITSALAPGRRWLSIPLFASLWVCLEYLIRAVAVGFSTYLGVTQWRVPALLGVASIGGIYAVTWLIVAANTAIAALSLPAVQKVLGRQASVGPHARRPRLRRWLPLALGLGALVALWTGGHVGPLSRIGSAVPDSITTAYKAGASLRLVLVQPQITPAEYRVARSGFDAQRELWQRVLAQTEGALSGLGGRAETATETLIVLPETVVHYTAWGDPLFHERFTQFARSEQIHWLIGLPRSAKVEHGSVGRDGPSPDSRERNSAFYIGRDGVRKAVYDKIYVIPVAESQFAPGATAGVIGVGGHLLGVGICSDVVVPDHALATMRAGAESLHYIASLGHIGGLTHLERAFVVFRAAEHGVYVTQTATTGPTLAVDPRGRVVAQAASAVPGELVVDIAPRANGPTPYTRLGDWVVLTSALILFCNGLITVVGGHSPRL